MKVLAVFPDLAAPNAGGVQVSAQLAWEMLQNETEARALEVKNRLELISAARAARFQPDVILFWHIDLLRLAPLMRTHAKRVLFLHGIEAWRRQDWLTRKLLRQTHLIANSRYTLERATPFIASARDNAAQVVQLGFGKPRVVRPPLFDVRAAVMIGRLDARERYKGHDEVIRAWPQVIRQLPDAQLWIVGDGNLRAELESLTTALGLDATVRFFGRLNEAEKENLLDAARCLVLPSRAEGFGLVYVEAMRAGRPCLVGNDAGREVVDPPQAGVAADPADTLSIVSALIHLLSDDAMWHRQSAAAHDRYASHFTAAHFQQRLLAALKRIR